MTRSKTAGDKVLLTFFYILLLVFALLCVIPFIITVSASFSSETAISESGFSILPKDPTLDTYKYMLMNKGSMILQAYLITLFTVTVGTCFSVAVSTCYAYAASVKSFRFHRALSFIAWFTMVFSGGVLPWYIVLTKYYGLQNNLFALFVPYAINVFYMFIIRNTFSGIPYDIVEAAKIDGAGNFRTFFTIMLPLARVGILTVTFFYALVYWNDFYLPLMLISKQKLYPMQMLLYSMQSNIQFLTSGSSQNVPGADQIVVPMLTSRMAMTCLAIGPIILLYPFVQKFFVNGMVVGAVKG